MKVVISNDAIAHQLKTQLVTYLIEENIQVLDLGSQTKEDEVSHIDAAYAVTNAIKAKDADLGIVLCGTGMGVALVANKQKGIYAAVVESEFAAEQCRVINNANVLALGCLIQSEFMAKRLVKAFLNTSFAEENTGITEAYQKMQAIEKENFKD